MWARPTKTGRAQPALDRARIVAGAVELLDRGTVSGLTMRKLATHLNTAPMTLYGYVATKDDLLEYAVDAVFAEMTDGAAPSGDWRTDLRSIGRQMFDALLRHAWAAELIGGMPPLGPAAVAQFRSIVGALGDAGFAEDRVQPALTAFYYYVLGAAVAESAWARAGSPDDSVRATITALDAGTGAAIPLLLDRPAPPEDRAQRFEQGLQCVLDGFEPPSG
ncbi:TetR family transcriptional regulator [Nocardia mexicana]|uniref:TetR family transcriptional regulator n=1 Tax=Nocardia mexicana TaxID=279262 RepID=A0A370H0Q6_9NOCA|nr:TetR family transcriptional regulator [Nocardia mexicana]